MLRLANRTEGQFEVGRHLFGRQAEGGPAAPGGDHRGAVTGEAGPRPPQGWAALRQRQIREYFGP